MKREQDETINKDKLLKSRKQQRTGCPRWKMNEKRWYELLRLMGVVRWPTHPLCGLQGGTNENGEERLSKAIWPRLPKFKRKVNMSTNSKSQQTPTRRPLKRFTPDALYSIKNHRENIESTKRKVSCLIKGASGRSEWFCFCFCFQKLYRPGELD